jgi:hypothetical protein
METVIFRERCFWFFRSKFSLRDFSHGEPKPNGLPANLAQFLTCCGGGANVIRRWKPRGPNTSVAGVVADLARFDWRAGGSSKYGSLPLAGQ